MSSTSPLDISIFDEPASSAEEGGAVREPTRLRPVPQEISTVLRQVQAESSSSPGADQGRFRQLVEFMVDSPEARSTDRAEEVALALSHLRSGLLDFLSILLPLIPARESKPAEHEFAQSPEVLEL